MMMTKSLKTVLYTFYLSFGMTYVNWAMRLLKCIEDRKVTDNLAFVATAMVAAFVAFMATSP